ncbi:MAG: flagellin lysine-N-methylase [Clostridia bacterium]|nr:flagellin lysine-N-methylase [Clostridia bacterium]
MKIFAPGYYEKFKCLANRCTHSCCVGWEIDVDSDALSRYSALGRAGEDILSTVDRSGECARFMLCDNGRCKNLRDDGLCRIICRFGEEYLCDICREHPRFYNLTARGREVGVGASCEAAADLILESDDYADFTVIGDEKDGTCADISYDVCAQREKIYKILSDRSIEYGNRLALIRKSFSVDPARISDGEWRSLISELEYLDGESRDLFLRYTDTAKVKDFRYAERVLAYFIYRHTGSAESSEDFRLSLGLALFLERLFVSISQGAEREEELIPLLVKLSEEIEYSEDNSELIKNEFLFM